MVAKGESIVTFTIPFQPSRVKVKLNQESFISLQLHVNTSHLQNAPEE